ncbi:MAG: ATP-binding cassette domain-containing protein [Crocinitomicaceae bacterium]|nr:ATP-binding cassette domain-containing protein [Crocinitomicaceae bacterium]
MTIEFNDVLPYPLEDYPHGNDSVWKNKFHLNFPKKVVLNASSGKGKTTFVNTLYGIRKDYNGAIKLDGKDISGLSLDEWIELRKNKLSVVFQDLQLFPELTVWENLILKNDLTQHQSEERIREMLHTLGIGDKEYMLCRKLSLGQQQRVAIIRALLQPFELLLMDEPFSHLDEGNAATALKLIVEETNKNNGGFILTTLGSYHGYEYEEELTL